MTIQDILEGLIKNINAALLAAKPGEMVMLEPFIAQAKSAIEEMFGEWVGSDTKCLHTSYGCDCLGYNLAKQEIRNRVKEVR
jgi:hypothetical protein